MEGYINTSSWDDWPTSTNLDRPTSVYVVCECGNGRSGIQIATKEERKTLPYRLVVTCKECGNRGKFAIEYGQYFVGCVNKLRKLE